MEWGKENLGREERRAFLIYGEMFVRDRETYVKEFISSLYPVLGLLECNQTACGSHLATQDFIHEPSNTEG